MFLFNRSKKNKDERSALVPGDTSVVAITVRQRKTKPPLLEDLSQVPVAGNESINDSLKQAVQQAKLHNTACSTLLDIGDYQLFLVDAPDVPPAELKDAIRWQIRELIDFNIDDAVIDVFDAPLPGGQNTQPLYVVVARRLMVEKKIEDLQSAGASLDIIDIPELALRNIASYLPEDANGLALLHLKKERGLITLTRESTLYLARTLDIGYRQLQESPDLIERLSLEIQRTLDYYESHFRQPPVAHVLITPLGDTLPQLAASINAQLGLNCREIALDEIVECKDDSISELAGRNLLALGAALRTEPSKL